MILKIDNRTENWKTAYEFAPLFKNDNARLKLVRQLGEGNDTESSQVSLELYWKGLRDYLFMARGAKSKKLTDEIIQDLAQKYDDLFPYLRHEINKYRCVQRKVNRRFAELKEWNYSIESRTTVLANNLYNTEVDIVLETPHRLFIGEAKHGSPFGSESKSVLVHQLIRQYVMAKILLNCLGCEKAIEPFVVGPNVKQLMKVNQVDFMIWKGWMKKSNVLSWSDISDQANHGS